MCCTFKVSFNFNGVNGVNCEASWPTCPFEIAFWRMADLVELLYQMCVHVSPSLIKSCFSCSFMDSPWSVSLVLDQQLVSLVAPVISWLSGSWPAVLTCVRMCFRHAAGVWRPGQWAIRPHHHRSVSWPGKSLLSSSSSSCNAPLPLTPLTSDRFREPTKVWRATRGHFPLSLPSSTEQVL